MLVSHIPICLRSSDSGKTSSDKTNDSGDPRHLCICVGVKPMLRYVRSFRMCKTEYGVYVLVSHIPICLRSSDSGKTSSDKTSSDKTNDSGDPRYLCICVGVKHMLR